MKSAEEVALSLGAKLEAMDLSDGERAALDAVFEALDADEVAGFAYDLKSHDRSAKYAGSMLSIRAAWKPPTSGFSTNPAQGENHV